MVEQVKFGSFSPALFRDVAREGLGAPVRATGELHMPRRAPGERVPAVVVMEGLGGLKHTRDRAYGRFFARNGYAALVVDSFASRHAARLPDNLRALLVTEAMMCADAFGALRYLQRRPEIDPGRVCVAGFSYGGMTSVLTAHAQIRELMATDAESFAGHVAFYGCSVARLETPTATGSPVLIVVGEKDRNVSLDRSRLIADDLRRGGAEVVLKVLDGTYHQWDGDDEDKRFIRFSLGRCFVRLGRDNELYEEKSGRRVRGRLSRALLLLLRVSTSGYHILRDEAARRHTDAMLLSFLARATASQPPPVKGRPTLAAVAENTGTHDRSEMAHSRGAASGRQCSSAGGALSAVERARVRWSR